MYQNLATKLVKRLLPEFQKEKKAFCLANFFGEYLGARKGFNYEPNERRILELETYLKEELAPCDLVVLKIRKEGIEDVIEGTEILLELEWNEIAAFDYNVLNIWENVYYRAIAYGKKEKEEVDQWEALVIRFLQHIKKHVEEDVISERGTYIIHYLLSQLWTISSKIIHPKKIQEGILNEIFEIIKSPNYTAENRKKILLMHELFEFPKNFIDSMAQRSGANEDNVYRNTLGEDVTAYILNFNLYKNELNLGNLPDELKQKYKTAVFDIWSYFYDTNLEEYLLSIIEIEPEEARTYFYLGQLYLGFENDAEKGLAFFEEYLALANDEFPANNFILTEQVYAYRCYQPSPPEALYWIGEIYEKEGIVDKAKSIYRNAIRLYPDYHLTPYLPLIRILLDENEYDLEAYDLLLKYYSIWNEKTVWGNSGFTNDNSPVDFYVSGNSKKWLKKYNYLVASDYDLQRIFGEKYLTLTFRYLFYRFAEWFYYEKEDLENTLDTILFAKKCDEKLPKYFNEKNLSNSPLPLKEVSEEDILYLHGDLMLEKYQDYWQARAIFNKILKLNKDHKGAKAGLSHIKKKLGY